MYHYESSRQLRIFRALQLTSYSNYKCVTNRNSVLSIPNRVVHDCQKIAHGTELHYLLTTADAHETLRLYFSLPACLGPMMVFEVWAALWAHLKGWFQALELVRVPDDRRQRVCQQQRWWSRYVWREMVKGVWLYLLSASRQERQAFKMGWS